MHGWGECKTITATVEHSMEIPQEIKNRIIIRSRNSMSGHIPKRIESRVSKRYLYTVFIAALLTIAKTWRQPMRPLVSPSEQVEFAGDYFFLLFHLFSLKTTKKGNVIPGR